MKRRSKGRSGAALTGKARARRSIPGALALGLSVAGMAQAGEFSLDNGAEGRWGLNMSLGTSIRAGSPDRDLIMTGNGGRAGSSHDDGNLNFGKGDAFSTIAKVVGEVGLKQGDFGLFVRGRAWYDYQLSEKGVRHGHSANGFVPGEKLNDGDFDDSSKFSGAQLLDAYVSWNSYLAGDKPFAIKFGNQVVNWGESLFIAGINQFGAFDISASRRPGAQLKEILMPIPQVSANLGLTENLSVEAFYQFMHRKNTLDGCGTYWSISDVYNCSSKGAVVAAGPFANKTDYANFNTSPTAIMANGGDRDPSDAGQWGLAARYFAPEISTEFGAYFANYHQRSPTISILFKNSPAPSAFSSGNAGMQYVWDWSGEDIKVFGLSASTNIAGWSVFGEISRTEDLPVQLNGLDLLRGASNGFGPLLADPLFAGNRGTNNGFLYHGYDRKDKNQVQISTIKSFPRVLGAENLMFMGEVAYQHWLGIDDPASGRRYGRGFVYGQASSNGTGCNGVNGGAYCGTGGFATSNAWGYRMQFELSYPDVVAGANLKPRVFWSHDVQGYSADNTFVKDRQILGLGVRLDYLNRYYADLSYNNFNGQATYDTFHDRDFYSAVVGMNF